MEAAQVDPRDISSVLTCAAFRVYFWDANNNSDEWRLEGGDLIEVMRWVASHRDGRTYELFAEVEASGDEAGPLTMVRLEGEDPTAGS